MTRQNRFFGCDKEIKVGNYYSHTNSYKLHAKYMHKNYIEFQNWRRTCPRQKYNKKKIHNIKMVIAFFKKNLYF